VYNCQEITIPFEFILWDRSGIHCTFSLKFREMFNQMYYDEESLNVSLLAKERLSGVVCVLQIHYFSISIFYPAKKYG